MVFYRGDLTVDRDWQERAKVRERTANDVLNVADILAEYPGVKTVAYAGCGAIKRSNDGTLGFEYRTSVLRKRADELRALRYWAKTEFLGVGGSFHYRDIFAGVSNEMIADRYGHLNVMGYEQVGRNVELMITDLHSLN